MGFISITMAASLATLVAQAGPYLPTDSDPLSSMVEFLQQNSGIGWGIVGLILAGAVSALSRGTGHIAQLIHFLGKQPSPPKNRVANKAPRTAKAQAGPRIFISYRRSDSIREAGRIYDYLESRLGRNALFKDVDTIEAGDDFRERVVQAVGQCQILLAVIGDAWLDAKDTAGRRRLENPADWVRLEIETALKRNIRVIPILLDGVSMPPPTDLPVTLQTLAYRNAAPVRHDPDFRRDMARLMTVIERHLADLDHP